VERSRLKRFDFLRDAPPLFVERLRPSRLPAELRTPLAAFATTVVVILAWWAIETAQIAQARAELVTERARVAASRTDLAQAQVRRSRLVDLISLDRRIRDIRRSGAALSGNLADIANHLPDRAWLTSIAQDDRGLEIDGNAVGLDGLSDTLAGLMSSRSAATPSLVRASRSDQPAMHDVISFQLRSGAGVP
jgi:Tfp pilus assembly protein PilN